MNDRYQDILYKVRLQYPGVGFTIIEEEKGIKFVYDDLNLIDNKIFFDFVCDVAFHYLIGKEVNMFSIVYDYYSEMLTTGFIG